MKSREVSARAVAMTEGIFEFGRRGPTGARKTKTATGCRLAAHYLPTTARSRSPASRSVSARLANMNRTFVRPSSLGS